MDAGCMQPRMGNAVNLSCISCCALPAYPLPSVRASQPRAAVLLTVRIVFFREDFRGDAAASSFVYLRFGRSRFLCRYERARSPIPMLRFGMRAPRPPQHAQRQKTHVSGAPARTRARFTLGRNSEELRVWVAPYG